MDKPIVTLNKPKSRQRIEIYVNYSMDEDGWFLDVQYIEKKTEKIASRHCIIRKDLDTWLRSLENNGWIQETK